MQTFSYTHICNAEKFTNYPSTESFDIIFSAGHGSLIGKETGKVIGLGTRVKKCRVCSGNEGSRQHDCRVNWKGSSKAMEADLAVEILNNTKEKHFEVSTLIGDDDTTTMARIKEQVPHPVKKWSDVNHAKKALGTSLYKLQKHHKQLTTPVIKYFQKCFTYALNQNKDDEAGVKKNILCIVPHSFGEHDKCGAWCGYEKNPDSYRHSSLPKGANLHGDEMRKDLEAILSIYAGNAQKLAPCGSTLANESFNNSVASKAPKARHYSGSESLDFRVRAAACQKNLGHEYIALVSSPEKKILEIFQKPHL